MVGRIFTVIGGLVAIALFAALLAPWFIDWTDFRRDFENQASRIIGKKVVVHGSVDARLLPFPSVTMNDVRVGEDGSGNALVTAERFSMESELAPYLSGEALIYNMRIENPKIRLKLTDDGTFDWVKTGTPEIPASNVVLEHVTVTNGDVLFIDEQTGRNRHLTGLNMELAAKSLAGPWKVSGKGAVDGQTGTFVLNSSTPDKGKIPLKLRLIPDNPALVAEMDGVIGLTDFRPEYKGSFNIREKFRSETDAVTSIEAPQQSSAPRIAGKFELLNDRLRIPEYEFKMGDNADPYIVTGEATIDAGRKPEFLVKAEGRQIDMSRFGGNSEGTTEVSAIPLADRIRAFMTLAADFPVPNLPGKASIRLPAVIAGDTTIRDIQLEMQPTADGWQIDQAEAQLPGRTTLSAKGKLTLQGAQAFDGELLLASNQPSGFAEWVTGSVPESIRKLKSAGFSANVSLTPELQRFEKLEIGFGPALLKGRLEHQAEDGKPPALSMDLAGNAFDLDTMLALGGLLTGEQSTKSFLDHRIAAHLKVDHFSAFGLDADGLDAAFSVANGAIGDVRASISGFYGAALNVEGGIADIAGTPKGGAKISVKSADPTAFFQLLADRAPHPALKRLAENARYYADSDFLLDLKLGLGDWPVEAKLTGNAHGSKFTANLASQSLNFIDPDGLTLDASLENFDAWVMLGQMGLSTTQFDADQDGLVNLKIEQTSDSDPQLSLKYSSATTTVEADGSARLNAANFLDGSYKLTVDSADIAPYLIVSGVTLPRLTDGLSLNGSANIYATPDGISVDSIKGSADDNKFGGVLSLDRKATERRFKGDLTLTSMDFGWLAETVYGAITEPLTSQLSRIDVPKNAGLPIDIDIKLASDALHLGALGDVKKFNGQLRTDRGKLELTNASGQLADGNFTGRAELGNIDGNAYLRTQMKVTGASLATAFWRHDNKPAASALSNLTLAIDTTGTSAVKMLQGATGSGTLTLKDLAVQGIDTSVFHKLLQSADSVDGEMTEAAFRKPVEQTLLTGTTSIGNLSIPFNITSGKLRFDNIVGSNKDASFEAEADIGLLDATISGDIGLTFKPGDDNLTGADPSIKLGWEGPLAAPKRSLDITALTSFLSLRKFEQERRRVEILQANIAEKQRLRREAALYRSVDAERERLKQKALDDARMLQQAQEALKAQAKAEQEERQKADAEKRKQEPNSDDQDSTTPKLDLNPDVLNQ